MLNAFQVECSFKWDFIFVYLVVSALGGYSRPIVIDPKTCSPHVSSTGNYNNFG